MLHQAAPFYASPPGRGINLSQRDVPISNSKSNLTGFWARRDLLLPQPWTRLYDESSQNQVSPALGSVISQQGGRTRRILKLKTELFPGRPGLVNTLGLQVLGVRRANIMDRQP